jgi:hypothetical protein
MYVAAPRVDGRNKYNRYTYIYIHIYKPNIHVTGEQF